MTIGIALNKAQLDADQGAAVLHLVAFMRMAQQLQETFNIHPDADFIGLNPPYTAAEVATMKTAWLTDAPQLIQIIINLATLGATKDFRAALFQMIGSGLA